MKIRIVTYEDVREWILGKFALKMQQHLREMSIEVDIADRPDPNADVNHHIMFLGYDGRRNSTDTIMITHVDAIQKVDLIGKQLRNAAIGICMSSDTMQKLISCGLPKDKLCFVNPAHDGIIHPRKIIVGVTSRTYDDGRKRKNVLSEVAKKISPKEFAFRIMGGGWGAIVDEMVRLGFDVDYHEKFDIEVYRQLIPALDYYLYHASDEGSMGFIDALSAGVETIVTPQGYHLDVPGGITYPTDGTPDNIVAILESTAKKKKSRARSVCEWTWKDYTVKHLQIWEYLLGRRGLEETAYRDGLGSLLGLTVPNPKRIGAGTRYRLSLLFSPITLRYLKGRIRTDLRKGISWIRPRGSRNSS